jgi:hypothetical protein
MTPTPDIETLWLASIALLSAFMGYTLMRAPGKWNRCHWFGKASVLLLFAMVCQTESSQPTTTTHVSEPAATSPDAFDELLQVVKHRAIAMQRNKGRPQ